jgi:hypothetical protein
LLSNEKHAAEMTADDLTAQVRFCYRAWIGWSWHAADVDAWRMKSSANKKRILKAKLIRSGPTMTVLRKKSKNFKRTLRTEMRSLQRLILSATSLLL